MLFSEQAAGSATGNTVTGTVTSAIQVGGTAHPDINANELRGGEYGLTYLDAAAGGASNNRFAFHRIGIQLAGTAAPSLIGNELDGIEAAAIVYAETSAGAATGNHCLGQRRPSASRSRRLPPRRSTTTSATSSSPSDCLGPGPSG